MIYEYGLFNEFKTLSEIQYEKLKDDLKYSQQEESFRLNINEYNFINKVSCYVVNSTFACEIALKAILKFNQILKRNYTNEVLKKHRLDDLFDLLDDIQQEIILSKLPLLKNKEELKKELKIIANNFVEWRYSFQTNKMKGEQNNLTTNVVFIKDFLNALDKFLIDL